MSPQTRTIGRFSDATLIGRGGFGAVYMADDAEHGRKVAIKVLPGTLGDTERRRFDRERQTMGRLGSHPNIIPVHESGYTDDGEGYIVMELASGGSLGDRLDQSGPLGWDEALDIAVAIAGAAQAAHDQGVLHRDIKPDNILIDAYGNPRLTDFGIAAVASNATATTSTTATLAHAAPELLNGQTSTVAVDIYAIGSTFYNLVMGRPPFMQEEDLGVTPMIGRALTQPPPDLRPLGVPPAVAAVVERSMAKEAGGRQRTAAELADELRAAKDGPGETVVAPPGDEPSAEATMVSPAPLPHPAPYLESAGPSSDPVLPAAHAPPPHLQPQGAVQPTASRAPQSTAPQSVAPQSVGGEGAAAAPPATPTGGGHSTGGGHPFGGDGAYAGFQPAPAAPPSRSRAPLLLALVAIGVAVMAAGAVLALTGGDDSATPPTTGTSEPGSSSITPPTTAPTTTGPATTPTTATTNAPTAPSSSATTPTTLAPSSCPVRIVDGRTQRFNVMICGDGTGGARYQANNRQTGDGIQLPACFAGFGLFVARNEGFTYEVDTESGFLFVIDPDGDVIVTEEFLTPLFVDLSPEFTVC